MVATVQPRSLKREERTYLKVQFAPVQEIVTPAVLRLAAPPGYSFADDCYAIPTDPGSDGHGPTGGRARGPARGPRGERLSARQASFWCPYSVVKPLVHAP